MDGQTAVPSTPPSAEHSPQALRSPARKLPLLLTALALAALWYAALATLTLRTANPVTVNLLQLHVADSVAQLHVLDPRAGTCRVVEVLAGVPLPEEIIVSNLQETSAEAGHDYLVPLSHHAGKRLVTTVPEGPLSEASPHGSVGPLIYRATADGMAQMRAALATTQSRRLSPPRKPGL